jgi:hypothetical protein
MGKLRAFGNSGSWVRWVNLGILGGIRKEGEIGRLGALRRIGGLGDLG